MQRIAQDLATKKPGEKNEMPRVHVSSVIDAPVARVWERVHDFNGLPRWVPAVRDSRIENGEPADRIGCVRDFHLQNGDRLREKLLGLSDHDLFCTYSILEPPMPLTGYVATLRLNPVTDGDRTFWLWESRFDTPAGREEELPVRVAENVYQSGIDAVRSLVEDRA